MSDDQDKKVARDAGSAEPKPAKDVALIHSSTADGKGLHIIRQRNDQLEFGAIRPLQEGVPITGEVVKLKPRAECPLLCDVETQFDSRALQESKGEPRRSEKGPAQVASANYRDNWDVIWNNAKARRDPEILN